MKLIDCTFPYKKGMYEGKTTPPGQHLVNKHIQMREYLGNGTGRFRNLLIYALCQPAILRPQFGACAE